MAQKAIIKKLPSYLMPQVAFLNGDNGVGAQIHLSGGLIKNNWHFGLGTAIDYYQLRTIPLYTDLQYHFGKGKKGFAYANLGYNFPWTENKNDRIYIMPPVANSSRFSGGLYTDLGIGYQIKIGKKNILALSAGYSVKEIREQYEELSIWSWPRPVIQPGQTDPNTRQLDYTFTRVSFKVGYRLW